MWHIHKTIQVVSVPTYNEKYIQIEAVHTLKATDENDLKNDATSQYTKIYRLSKVA